MPESAFEYLSSHSLLFLATASSDGNVHVAPMFYATEGRGVFFSAPASSETAAAVWTALVDGGARPVSTEVSESSSGDGGGHAR